MLMFISFSLQGTKPHFPQKSIEHLLCGSMRQGYVIPSMVFFFFLLSSLKGFRFNVSHDQRLLHQSERNKEQKSRFTLIFHWIPSTERRVQLPSGCKEHGSGNRPASRQWSEAFCPRQSPHQASFACQSLA